MHLDVAFSAPCLRLRRRPLARDGALVGGATYLARDVAHGCGVYELNRPILHFGKRSLPADEVQLSDQPQFRSACLKPPSLVRA